MKIKKFIKNLTLFATFILSLSLNISAIRPTPEQLESFYSPFERIYSKSITIRYPNIKYLAGIEKLRGILSQKFHSVGETPHYPTYFGTLRQYESYLISYTKSITKILALDEQIDSFRRTLLSEAVITSTDANHLLFYEELATILSTSDCNEFIEKAKQFIEKWNRIIIMNSNPTGEVFAESDTEKFIEAQSEAKRNFELYLDQLRKKDENDI